MEDNKEDLEQKEKEQKEKIRDQIQEEKIEEHKEEVKKDFKDFSQSLEDFFSELLNIKSGTDKEATAESIKKSISMKGHTAWILVFSIFIASIGLNVSSTAVVIGAMLISPLMGPIVGIGFSIGINDVDTLRSSIINSTVMVVLSIVTSFLFFSFPIFQEATPEILARTKPDVRDVLIAVSGGLALFIAISRPSPQFNTVAGVAIATALMPPLCTAGFGLATGQLSYFAGALFLFTINSIFIALAAFVTTKYLHFPVVKYIKQTNRKRISQIAYTIAFVILLFSIYLFYQLYMENHYKTKAGRFIDNIKNEGVNIIGDEKEIISYQDKEIKLFVFGNDYSENDRIRWEKQLEVLGLEGTKLTVLQSQDDSKIRSDIDQMKDIYLNNQEMLTSKDESIREKDIRIKELEKDLIKYYDNEMFFEQVVKEIQINYDDLNKISFAKEYVTNFREIDTIPVISVKWDSKLNSDQRNLQEVKLKKWLQTRLKIKNIEFRELE
ncbi:MAG: TIGR00341 family protein [Bacteroidota bacterium]